MKRKNTKHRIRNATTDFTFFYFVRIVHSVIIIIKCMLIQRYICAPETPLKSDDFDSR